MKIILFLVVLTFCKLQRGSSTKPERLIEKDVMVDIMYDLSILAIKYQNPASLDTLK
jgi:hypothetical protein